MSVLKFGFTAEQIIEEGLITNEDLNLVKTWLSVQEFPKLTNEQLALFLLSCNKDQNATRSTIRAFHSVRNGAPHIFTNRKIQNEELQAQLHVICRDFCVFPTRTDDGCVVVCNRLNDTNYAQYDMEAHIKLFFMSLDAALYDYPSKGLVILFDLDGVGLMHLTKFRFGLVRIFFQYLQEALPVGLKVIHILNSVYFIDKIMALIRPFAKQEVLDKLHFHSPNMDMELFYAKCLPQRCLPKDYGGHLPSIRELHQQNVQKLADMESHFEAEETQRCVRRSIYE